MHSKRSPRKMEVEWKRAIQWFIVNSLGDMSQEDIDAWLRDELALAPALEEPLKALSQHRDNILRDMYQMSPPEVFDRFLQEHPEITFEDKDRAIVRIGKELEEIKAFLMSL
jgi:hypothetical protein